MAAVCCGDPSADGVLRHCILRLAHGSGPLPAAALGIRRPALRTHTRSAAAGLPRSGPSTVIFLSLAMGVVRVDRADRADCFVLACRSMGAPQGDAKSGTAIA